MMWDEINDDDLFNTLKRYNRGRVLVGSLFALICA
jgi:hypothetical protein